MSSKSNQKNKSIANTTNPKPLKGKYKIVFKKEIVIGSATVRILKSLQEKKYNEVCVLGDAPNEGLFYVIDSGVLEAKHLGNGIEIIEPLIEAGFLYLLNKKDSPTLYRFYKKVYALSDKGKRFKFN